MVLYRKKLGDVLRQHRLDQGRTLRQLSSQASVSLGYMSEIERGHKEASSELLSSICSALEIPLSAILSDVAHAVAADERGVTSMQPRGLISAPSRVVDAQRSANDVVASAA